LIAIAPVRDAGSVLAPAENRTDPSPWPSAGEPIVSHGASAFADHWQSRFVVMRSEPEPPAAGTDGLSVVTCKPHFVDGAVMLSVCEEDPHAYATSAATISVVNAVNERDGPLRPTVATVVDAQTHLRCEGAVTSARHVPKSSNRKSQGSTSCEVGLCRRVIILRSQIATRVFRRRQWVR
jgi:hypothetical protein